MLKPDTLPEAVFNLAMSGRVQLCVSEPILAEYEDVLRRLRLGIGPKRAGVVLGQIREAAQFFIPTKTVTVAGDSDDNMFLECAEAAHADYLVTGNLRHFPDRWKKPRVIGPRELIEALIDEADTGIR